MTEFQSWLTVFTEEKGIDLSEPVLGKDGCFLQVGDVLSAMMSAPPLEQKKIKETFVAIDFKNGDILHFIRHAAQALGPEYKIGL